VDFEREQIDAAIWWGDGIRRGLEGVRLFRERLVPVCAPRLAAEIGEEGGEVSPGALSRNVLLHSFRRPDDWRRWFAAAGLAGIELDRLLVFENSSLTYQGAIDGLGIAIAQQALIREDIAAGRLVIANALTVETGAAYFLTYPRERADLSRIRALHAWGVSVAE
jgi:LysR family glycine cleavage system transcriptional activator